MQDKNWGEDVKQHQGDNSNFHKCDLKVAKLKTSLKIYRLGKENKEKTCLSTRIIFAFFAAGKGFSVF